MEIREFRRRDELAAYLEGDPEVRGQLAYEAALAARHRDDEEFTLDGWCPVCAAPAAFLVDRLFGARETPDGWVPNWRERLVCPGCSLNNRQRAMIGAVLAAVERRRERPLALYAMEQISPTFRWLSTRVEGLDCTGSEYLGEGIAGGTIVDGVLPGLRHEDVEALSFAGASFDLIVSNDVLEHVARPAAALGELARVLRPGGELLVTVPFWIDRDRTVRRAERAGGEVRHLLPPVYHGDPLSEQGSLVFHDFGWDLLDVYRETGLEDVALRLYWSARHGHLGCPLYYFRARKPGDRPSTSSRSAVSKASPE